MNKRQYAVSILAPVEKVWNTMLGPGTYKIWAAEFAPDCYFEGSWDKGAEIRFLSSPSGDGMYSVIVENNRYEFISIKHVGMIINGIVDTESPDVKKWTPAYENYSFSSINEVTEIIVDIDLPEDYVNYFEEVWPRALAKLKQICEE